MIKHTGSSQDYKVSIDEEDKVKDYTLTFIFDEDAANTEFEHVQCFMRSLANEITYFSDEEDLKQKLGTQQKSSYTIFSEDQ